MQSSNREIKIEFFVNTSDFTSSKVLGTNLFAVESNFEYNILSINDLFADKLTTLGPNTVGIQDNRMDEQVKQLYDIWMLIKYNFEDFDLLEIKQKYISRSKLECISRQIAYDIDIINADVFGQLRRIAEIDCTDDRQLKRFINNFKSLYLNSNVDFSLADVAIAAEQIKLIFESVFNDNSNCSILMKAFELEKMLNLTNFSGVEKGNKTCEIRGLFIKEFASSSTINPNVLKGKNLTRVFWSVVNKGNIKILEELLFDCLEL